MSANVRQLKRVPQPLDSVIILEVDDAVCAELAYVVLASGERVATCAS